MRRSRIGEQYGLWTIVGISDRRYPNGKILYKCKCPKCGNTSDLTLDNIKRSRSRNCAKCSPDYKFITNDTSAMGTLPDGTNFLIDREDVEKVLKIRWFYNKSTGYIVTSCAQKRQIPLHRYVLDIRHEDPVVVDHINRDKTDCRKKNLRVATVAQNTLNKSKRYNNRYGLIGISKLQGSEKYRASIQIGHKGIILGKSEDPIECAQMYNLASTLLFGEFQGYINNVPEPSQDLREKIEGVCKPYLKIAEEITRPANGPVCFWGEENG